MNRRVTCQGGRNERCYHLWWLPLRLTVHFFSEALLPLRVCVCVCVCEHLYYLLKTSWMWHSCFLLPSVLFQLWWIPSTFRAHVWAVFCLFSVFCLCSVSTLITTEYLLQPSALLLKWINSIIVVGPVGLFRSARQDCWITSETSHNLCFCIFFLHFFEDLINKELI